MKNILQLIGIRFIGGIVFAVGFAGFLYILYHVIKLMSPKETRQEEQRILSHRFYKISGRGRACYLILCLERALQFYGQDFAEWEWILRKLWSITDNPESNWIDVWLDSVGKLLPSEVLTNNDDIAVPEEIIKAKKLYTKAGTAMIVIDTILDSVYTMVCQWSPDTATHDPDALKHIDRVEEIMEDFKIPIPSNEIIEKLLSEEKSSSFGKPFDGLRFSELSREK